MTAPAPSGLRAALERAAKPFHDAKVRLRIVASPAVGRQLLEDNGVDALLLLSADRLLFRSNVHAKPAAAVADTAVRAIRNHKPPTPELTAATLHPPEKTNGDAETLVSMVGSGLLLFSLAGRLTHQS